MNLGDKEVGHARLFLTAVFVILVLKRILSKLNISHVHTSNHIIILVLKEARRSDLQHRASLWGVYMFSLFLFGFSKGTQVMGHG